MAVVQLEQEAIFKSFQQKIREGRLATGYILAGSAGLGKAALAEAFASEVVCPVHGGETCVCSSCRRVNSRQHPDVLWIGEDRDEKNLKIETVREIQHWLSLKPFEASRKVVILIEAERLTVEGQNAFLKTLEEPPGDALIILTVVQPLKLLPTIASRLQTVSVQPLALSKMKELLRQDFNLGESENWIVYQSRGSLGEARELIEAKLPELRLAAMEAFFEGKLPEFFKTYDQKKDEKSQRELSQVIDCYLVFLRDLLLVKSGGNPESEVVVNRDYALALTELAQNLMLDKIVEAFEQVRMLKDYERSNVSAKMIASTLQVVLGKLKRQAEERS